MKYQHRIVIIQLMGGLGNQLFQYAAARRLAYERDAILMLDISYYKTDKLREYKLNNYKVQQNFATELETLPFQSRKLFFRLLRLIKRLIYPYYKGNIYFETARYKFDEKFLQTNNFVYLKGYFQNEKYFLPIESILRNELCPVNPISEYCQKIIERIASANSVSIHIRRGDYASDPKIRATRGLLYERAVEYIAERVTQPYFFVFSDDPLWARENLNVRHPVTWIDLHPEQKDFEDLWLMSQCHHHIIANSSFSWWGAWLSSFPKKIVIAPDRWVLNSSVDTNDLIPNSWYRI
jgi:hypothetical protein